MNEINQLTKVQYDILVEMSYDWCYPFSYFNGTREELRKELLEKRLREVNRFLKNAKLILEIIKAIIPLHQVFSRGHFPKSEVL